MLRIAWSQITRRRARSLALVAAIVVAAVSFSLLTSAVGTSRLEVKGTVEENFRSAYDILVRPPGSKTPLERSEGLVQENYLAGIYGGISVRDYERVAGLSDVEVAAPIAMVGYVLPQLHIPQTINHLLTDEPDQLYVVKRSWLSDRGLSTYPDRSSFVYFSRRPAGYSRGYGPFLRDPVTGRKVAPCQAFGDNHAEMERSAFDWVRRAELFCSTSNPPSPVFIDTFRRGDIGYETQFPFPMLVAAIDPAAEAELVGLDEAMVSGRYLDDDDRVRVKNSFRQVPVLMADEPMVEHTAVDEVHRIPVREPGRLASRLASPDARRWLLSRPSQLVETRVQSHADLYQTLLRKYAEKPLTGQVNYWATGPVDYAETADGALRPRGVPPASPDTWLDYRIGYVAPPANADVAFRPLEQHTGSNSFDGGIYGSPNLRQVGVFDPDRIDGFSELSEVPLSTYVPPSGEPGDPRTRRLLHGKPLLPSANLAGYLQQPPMMLTTLRSVPAFYRTTGFSNIDPQRRKAPISVIRVRVAGVTGADEASRARVRLVAERIVRETGLDVDITIGSSPAPQKVTLPAGDYGRPQLSLDEGWVAKNVAVRLLSALDRKSLALFTLVLVVCVLFLLNATIAAVRTRRAELGVLACLGWPVRKIFALLLVELFATGLVAGLAGTLIALGLTRALDLQVGTWQLALITPVATLLATLSGMGPAWRASRATPLQALQPDARAPRRADKVRSVGRLAWSGVRRTPGRAVLGVASMFLGVAALSVLLAVQTAFSGGIAGTLLGDYVAIQVRGVDYLAAVLTIALGGFAVADIAYLNITERRGEIGTLRATGWRERHIRRLFGTESLIIATAGAVTGAVLGVTVTAVLLHIPFGTSATAAGLGAACGVLAAGVALTVPLTRLNSLAPSAAISSD